MKANLIAHLRHNEDQTECIQTVAEHCQKTAAYAESALDSIQMGKMAHLCGLLHDAGKCTAKFAEYITKAARGESVQRGSVNHTFAAVRFILSNYHGVTAESTDDLTAEILAFATGAHHGLFDCVDETGDSGFGHRMNKANIGYEEAIVNYLQHCAGEKELASLFAEATKEFQQISERLIVLAANEDEAHFFLHLVARLLLSAVIEADRKDTREFMQNMTYPANDRDIKDIWEAAGAHLGKKLATYPADSEIDKARRIISEKCLKAAEKPPGIYRLNVPTGAGKTLSSLRFAITHSLIHKKKRIIYSLPTLSIIEQNAAVIRAAIGSPDIILEHHSDYVATTEENAPDELNRRELLCDNWSSPIIITTLVQLMNTLFSGKTTSIRRFQSLCDSVIIFDEVQTIPIKMLSLFDLAISFLADVCGATILLCSATQPYFESARHPLRKDAADLITVDDALKSVFRRTTIEYDGAMSLEEIAIFARSLIHNHNSLLIICNKKNDAAQLFRELENDENFICTHLSAAMCPAHRKDVLALLRQTLDTIQMALKNRKPVNKKIICVSTQVVEAGVDISFESVLRFEAGIDSVIQAAGRCNRHNEKNGIASVHVVSLKNENLERLKEIKRGKLTFGNLQEEYKRNKAAFDNDLASEKAIRQYYIKYYKNTKSIDEQDYPITEPDRTTLFDLLATNRSLGGGERNDYFLRQAFQTAGKAFSLYDDNTVSVLVPYKEGKSIIADLLSRQGKFDIESLSAILQKAKPYFVSIYPYQQRELEKAGALYQMENAGIYYLSANYYDEEKNGFVANPICCKHEEV